MFLRQNPPEGAVVVQANYSDNPWFPAELEQERLIDLAGDAEVYRHVWLGDYERVGDTLFVPAGLVEKAMGADVQAQPFDECVIGVDVARFGQDETVIAVRRGRNARHEWHAYTGLDTMEVAARVATKIIEIGPDAVFVDEGAMGAGVVDRLRQLGHDVTGVNFGSKPDGLTKVKTANKRAEMWQRMKEWLAQGGVAIPRDTKLEAQLTGVQYKHDANNAILLERKEYMRKRGLASPDRADALALTFAYPVTKRAFERDDYQPEHGRSDATGY